MGLSSNPIIQSFLLAIIVEKSKKVWIALFVENQFFLRLNGGDNPNLRSPG
jgi:hypothetical protein